MQQQFLDLSHIILNNIVYPRCSLVQVGIFVLLQRIHIDDQIVNKFSLVVTEIYFGLLVLITGTSQLSDVSSKEEKQTTNGYHDNETQPLLLAKMKESDEMDKENHSKQPNPNPQLTACCLHQLFFTWFNGIVWTGFRRTLQFSDIYDIRPTEASQNIVQKFEKEWNKRLLAAGYKIGEGGAVTPDGTGRHLQKRPSLPRTLAAFIGPYYLVSGLLLLVQAMVQLLNPQILNALIKFVEDKENPYIWHGYVLATTMFFFSVVTATCVNLSANITYIIGMRTRSALITAIYRKTLRLSSASRKMSSGGEIVNLMSVDAQKMQDCFQFLHYLWVAPIQIAVAIYFLWLKLGVATLAGVAFMVVALPLNSIVLGKKIREYQMAQMLYKDQRIKLINQVLAGIKVLKLYAWEPYFRDKIMDLRNKELHILQKIAWLTALNSVISFSSNAVVALLCFVTYASTSGKILSPDVAFVSLSLLNVLNGPFFLIPMGVFGLVQGLVSVRRLNDFLLRPEVDPDSVSHNYSESAITIQDGNFSWGGWPILKSIDLEIPTGSLVAVVGHVGQGKSSLLSATLGEMEKNSGFINTYGSLAYVSQQAWIQNLSLRDNILFSKSYKKVKYDQIIEACALEQDLNILAAGDLTEIGEKGINLSGGQKQRVSLARAIYQNGDVYLLDDPLSAVDAHVGKHIFEKVIGPQGLLRNKTRLLVTNAVNILPKVDCIIVMKDGTVSETGTYDQLLAADGAFSEFIKNYLQEVDNDETDDPELEEVHRDLVRRISRLVSSDGSVTSGTDQEVDRSNKTKKRKKGTSRTTSVMSTDEVILKQDPKKSALILEEATGEGSVSLAVIKSYIQAASVGFLLTALLGLAFNVGGQVGYNIWLSEWSGDASLNETEAAEKVPLRLGVYSGLGVVQVLGTLVLSSSVALGAVRAAKSMHHSLLANIVRCPMSFFDTTPLGRLLNRFSKDVDTLDSELRTFILSWMTTLTPILATIIIITYTTPVFIAVVVPLISIFVALQRVYVSTARQLKRIDSVRRSPIYANFSETINGVSSVRAYEQQKRFITHADYLLDENQKVWFLAFTSNRWISVVAELLADFIILFAAFFCVIQRDSIDAGTAGLSLTYALQVTFQIVLMVRFSCEVETYIVSVERIKEYMNVPNEARWRIADSRPSPNWPEEGVVKFDEYSTRYRTGLDLVLKGVSFQTNSAEKVGIVGRTGAGKSSTTLSLFRIIESAGGAIYIDGVDISTLGLHDIRSRITIIPQDPILFSGTLRFNLDPAESFTDAEVWDALKHSHLHPFVSSLQQGLCYECGEDGCNLSVGQRQLVCLARALLRKTKILVLDEATAAVDLETDDLIQNTIRTEFKDCTIITIAHRLNTILDYDRILVMAEGRVKEFDSPDNLLMNPKSLFHSMAKDAGLL